MTEKVHTRFADRCIVSCGMLHPELSHLEETGFLNPHRLLFTSPGLHALPLEAGGASAEKAGTGPGIVC